MNSNLPTKPPPSRAKTNWIKAKDLLKNAKVFNRSVEERKELAIKNKLEEIYNFLDSVIEDDFIFKNDFISKDGLIIEYGTSKKDILRKWL